MKQKAMQLTTGMVTGLLMTALSLDAFAANEATQRKRGLRKNSQVSAPLRRASAVTVPAAQTSATRSVAQTGSPRQLRNDTAPGPAAAPSGGTPKTVTTQSFNADGTRRERTSGTSTPSAPQAPSLYSSAPLGNGAATFKPGPGVTTNENDEKECKGGYERRTKYSTFTDPATGKQTRTAEDSCEPTAAYQKEPVLYDACAGDPYKNKNNANMPHCASAWNNSDLNTCGKKEKEAREAYNKFSQACADAGMAGVKTCMDEAKACVTASEDEDVSSKGEFDNDFWRALGLSSDQKFSNQKERVKKCSVYGLKDYESEKRERSRALRDAGKEMADLQKDLTREKKDLAEKKKDLSQDFVKMQADMRKDMEEQQRAQAEDGMRAQQQMMEIDQQKAELRAANIEARKKSAEITGQRSVELAGLSDAMIHTNCMVELEKAISEMKAGMQVGGWQIYSQSYGERKRRLLSIKELCYARYEAARAATYKAYRAEIDMVNNLAAENNRRVAALDEQKNQVANNQAQSVQRAQQSMQQANSELYQKMQAVQMQMQELQSNAQQSEMAANQSILQAQQRMNEAQVDIRDLGAKPKGLKQPTEAAAQFRAFANTVKAMESDVFCKDEVERLLKIVQDASLKDYYDNDMSGDSDSDSGRD